MRKFTFCVTAALAALVLVPSVARAEITKQKQLTIPLANLGDSVEVVLQKGTYTFAGDYAGADATTLKVFNGKTDITAGVTLKGQTTVKIVWTLDDTGHLPTAILNNKVSISTKDDEPIKAAFTQELAIQSNKAGSYTDDATLQALALQTSKIQVNVNNLTWDQFEEYQTTGHVAAIEASISELGAKIEDAVANYEAYQTAKAKYAEIQAEETKLKDAYKAAAKETQESAKDLYNGLLAQVKAYNDDAKAAYDGAEVNAANKSSYVDALTKNAAALIKSLQGAVTSITTGSNNAISYANVNAEITKANNEYNKWANALFDLLVAPADGEVYNDVYVASLTDLNSSLRKIMKVEEENQALYDEGKADATSQAAFITRLTAAMAEMEPVYNHYNDSATTLRANYAAACKDIKDNIEAVVKSDIEGAYGKRDAVKKYYASALAAINDKIKALQANVDDANKKHIIKGTAPFCNKYSDDKKAILSDIAKLNEKIGYSVAEYDANENSKNVIKTLQANFDAKKKAVAKLTSDDKKYTGKDRYPAVEKAIQDSINVLTAKREAAYPGVSEKKLDAAQKYYAALSTAKIDAAIVTYTTDADDALAAYNTVAAALTDFAKNMDALKKVVKSNLVTVDGTSAGKSYGDSIAVLDAFIAKITNELAAAQTKYDVDHVKAMKKIDAKASTTNAQLIALKDNYAANETAWNAAQLKDTKDRLLTDAERRINALELPASYAFDDYGKTNTVLNDTLAKIKTDLAAQQAKVDAAKGYSEAQTPEAIALLAEIATDVDKLQTRATAMKDKAAKAKSEYTAEKNAKKGIADITAEYEIKLNGGKYGKVDYKGVAASYTGTRIDFTTDIAAVQGDIDQLNADLAASFTAETVRKDLEDVKDKDGKVTKKGFTTRANELKAAVDQLLVYAANETANDKANSDFNDALTAAKVGDLITAANTDINKVATGDGLAFFLGAKGLQGYSDEYDKIQADQAKAYAAQIKDKKFTDTSKNMTASLDALKARLTAVADNIKGLKALAEANEKQHKSQTDESAKTSTTWTKLFAEITGSETSNVHDSIIADMTQLKKDLVKYDADVAAAFKAGKCDTDKATLEAALTAINNSLKTIGDGWKDIYTAAVAVDNQERKARFDAAYKTLSETYSSEVELVEKMRKLSYANTETAVLNLITGKGGLFEYAEKIRTLKSTVEAEYTATVAPVLFDAEEAWKDTAALYKTQIENLVKQYTDAVNTVAQTTYTAKSATAQAKVDAVVADLKSVLGESDKDAKAAVKTYQGYIDQAKKDALEQDFAYRLDETILPNFEKIDKEINGVKETEAVKVWDSKMSAATKLATDEKAEIAKFVLPTGEYNTAAVDDYKADYDVALDNAAKKWSKSKKFSNFTTAYNTGLSYFEGTQTTRKINKKDVKHTAIYWAAYDTNEAYFANDKAYASMLDTLAVAQADFAALEEFAGSFFATYNLTGIASDIAGKEAFALSEFEAHTAPASLAGFQADVNVTITDIAAQYPFVIDAENAAIGVAILDLNYDYDKATAADLENEKLDAYKAIIAGYQAEKEAIYDAYTVGKKDAKGKYIKNDKNEYVKATIAETQAAYIALEKKMGVTKAELTAVYNAAAFADIKTKYEAGIAAINADYDAFVAQLAACHEPIIAQFTADVEAVKTASDAAKAEFDQMAADSTLVLYEDNIDAKIASIKASYANLKNNIKNAEKPYADNDSQYAKLDKQLKDYEAKLAKISDLAQYEYYGLNAPDTYYYWNYDAKTKKYQDSVLCVTWIDYDKAYYTHTLVEPARKDLEDKHNAEDIANALKTTSNLLNDATLKSALVNYEYNYAGYNVVQHFTPENYKFLEKNKNGEDLKTIMSDGTAIGKIRLIRRTIDSNVYDDGVPTALDAMLDKVADTLNAIYNYASDFYYNAYLSGGKWKIDVNYDIYGNPNEDKDKDGNPDYKTYEVVKEYPNILAALAKVAARLDEIAQLAYSTKGDVSGDGQIDVEDVQDMVTLVFAENPTAEQVAAADMNNDGVIDAADVVMLVNVYVYGSKYGNGAAFAPFRYVKADENITLSNDENNLSVSLNNVFSYSAIQMDVTLPENASIEALTVAERAQNHEIEAAQLSNGAWRIILYSVGGNTFADKSGELFSMTINSEIAGLVQIDNIKAIRTSGNTNVLGGVALGINGTTVVADVEANESADIYSIDGIQRSEMGNGINIIRSKNGAVKKVIVK